MPVLWFVLLLCCAALVCAAVSANFHIRVTRAEVFGFLPNLLQSSFCVPHSLACFFEIDPDELHPEDARPFVVELLVEVAPLFLDVLLSWDGHLP